MPKYDETIHSTEGVGAFLARVFTQTQKPDMVLVKIDVRRREGRGDYRCVATVRQIEQQTTEGE